MSVRLLPFVHCCWYWGVALYCFVLLGSSMVVFSVLFSANAESPFFLLFCLLLTRTFPVGNLILLPFFEFKIHTNEHTILHLSLSLSHSPPLDPLYVSKPPMPRL